MRNSSQERFFSRSFSKDFTLKIQVLYESLIVKFEEFFQDDIGYDPSYTDLYVLTEMDVFTIQGPVVQN